MKTYRTKIALKAVAYVSLPLSDMLALHSLIGERDTFAFQLAHHEVCSQRHPHVRRHPLSLAEARAHQAPTMIGEAIVSERRCYQPNPYLLNRYPEVRFHSQLLAAHIHKTFLAESGRVNTNLWTELQKVRRRSFTSTEDPRP